MFGQSNKVTILEKPEGETWSRQEVDALVQKGSVEVEGLTRAKPNRIVAMNKPLRGGTFQEILGDNCHFTATEADFRDRWV